MVVMSDLASAEVAVAVPGALSDTVTDDPTCAPLPAPHVPVSAGVSWLGPHRKKVTVPVGVGAVPPPLAVPLTVAASVIGSVDPSWRVDCDGVVVIERPHAPRTPR